MNIYSFQSRSYVFRIVIALICCGGALFLKNDILFYLDYIVNVTLALILLKKIKINHQVINTINIILAGIYLYAISISFPNVHIIIIYIVLIICHIAEWQLFFLFKEHEKIYRQKKFLHIRPVVTQTNKKVYYYYFNGKNLVKSEHLLNLNGNQVNEVEMLFRKYNEDLLMMNTKKDKHLKILFQYKKKNLFDTYPQYQNFQLQKLHKLNFFKVIFLLKDLLFNTEKCPIVEV